jgi:hypothetical protein
MQSDMHAHCSMPLGSWRTFCSAHVRDDQRPALAQGHKCDIVYFDVYPNSRLEEYSKEYSRLLESHGEEPLSVRRLDTVEDVLKQSDVSVTDKPSAVSACVQSGSLRKHQFSTSDQAHPTANALRSVPARTQRMFLTKSNSMPQPVPCRA